MSSFFHRLGERAAPTFLKARWLYRSFTGTETERIRSEIGMGRYLAFHYLKNAPRDPDPEAAQLLSELGGQLGGWVANRDWRFRFFSVTVPEVNAFAFPGGFIFLSRSLLDLCRFDRDELAFVLAHEMGHVVKTHAFSRILASEATSILSRKILSGTTFAQVLRVLTRQLVTQGYSRRNEMEADQFAIRLTKAAGFDPEGSVRLLRRLRVLYGEGDLAGTYFSSHPPFADRIAAAERRIRRG